MADIDTVRLLCADVNDDPTKVLLTDPQLQSFLDLEGGSIRLAAAQGLDTIASSEVLVSKVITANGLTTNGAAVSKELRARAESLREQENLYGDDGGYFEIIPPACADSWPYVGWC
jgi:hypothetical protein